MICDNCYLRDGCQTRLKHGKHLEQCDQHFPDLRAAQMRPALPSAQYRTNKKVTFAKRRIV